MNLDEKRTLTLIQNANPIKLRVRAKLGENVNFTTLRLGLGLRWTWRLGLGQIECFVVIVLWKRCISWFAIVEKWI